MKSSGWFYTDHFIPIAAQGHDTGLIFQGKRQKHSHKSKITQLESAIVRKVT